MKKGLLFVVALVAISFASCKKNYTCECTGTGISYTYDLGKIKKKDAKDACDAAGSAWILIGGTCTSKVK